MSLSSAVEYCVLRSAKLLQCCCGIEIICDMIRKNANFFTRKVRRAFV